MKNSSQLLLSDGLFGFWLTENDKPTSSDTVSPMQKALHTRLTTSIHSSSNYALGSTGSTSSLGTGGFTTIVGSPYWIDADDQRHSDEYGHANTLATAYEKNGIGCLSKLRGAFSFAIADSETDTFYAGIDRLGKFPLHYTPTNSGIILGSNASSVLSHPNLERDFSNQGIYDYVYFHMVPSPDSIFQGLKKLPAAHYLKCDTKGISTQKYWVPEFSKHQTNDFPELKKQFQDALRNSVGRSMIGGDNIASFLSGGLDSSTVTGVLAELSDGQAEAYSIGFDADGYDEMAYARIAAKHFGVHLNEYYVTPDDVVDALPQIATSYDEPFGNSSALPAWFCSKFATDNGVTRLLAGDGGDELFAGNERYSSQDIFELYQKIPKVFRASLIEPLVRSLPASIPLASKAKGYIQQANTELPERLQHYNFLNRHEAKEIFSDDFLANVDTHRPLQLLNSIYHLPGEGVSPLNKMLYLDWQLTLADNDLRKVSHTAALAGAEVHYPLIDDELVEMSCRVSDTLKLKNGNLRHFFKESLKGWLPDETISKKKHGFGLPFGIWMRTHAPLRDMAYETLLQLKKRHYFKPEFIEKTISLHRDGHASYYGELIWILVTFELWMNQADSSRRSLRRP